MSKSIKWTDEPAQQDHVPRFDIEVVPAQTPIRGVFVNQHIDGFESHYDVEDKATVPCLDLPHCSYCKRRVRVRWDGFILVQSYQRRLYILRVSDGMRRQLKSKTDIKRLRGLTWLCKRTGPHRNSPIEVQLGAPVDDGDLLGVRDIKPTIARSLGLDREKQMHVEFHEDRGEVVFHDFTHQIPTN